MDTVQTPTIAPASTNDPNAKSGLLLVTYLIPLVAIYTVMKKGENPFFLSHSKNAAGYLVVWIAVDVLLQIMWRAGPSIIPLAMLFNLILFVLFVYVMYFGAYAAWQGKMSNMPVITAIGQKIPMEKWFKKSVTPASTTPAASAPAQTVMPKPAPMTEPMPVITPTPEPTPEPMPEPVVAPTPEAPVVTPAPEAPTPPPATPEAPAAPQA